MQIGGAATEQLQIAGAGRRQQNESEQRQPATVLAQSRATQTMIEHPAERQRGQAGGDRLPGRQRQHRRVNQIQPRIEVIDRDQQQKAEDPGAVGFPFEPGQLGRQLTGRHQIFLDVIEAAAMHLPAIAFDSLRQSRPGPQAEIGGNEVERRADPGDPGDDVGPAQQGLAPLVQHVKHRSPSPPLRLLADCCLSAREMKQCAMRSTEAKQTHGR